jgi:hypothetical protein
LSLLNIVKKKPAIDQSNAISPWVTKDAIAKSICRLIN